MTAPLPPPVEDMVARWMSTLAARGRARRTREEYRAEVTRFLGFLAGHLGAWPDPGALGALTIADFRAWMAWEHGRGLSPGARARAASAVRGFFDWLAEAEGIDCPAAAAVRTPRKPRSLPRPVAAPDAEALIETLGRHDGPAWIAARDAALVTLIWGAGLRISEALSLTQAHAPLGEVLRITGKGGRLRDLPVLPASHAAVERYRALCPHVAGPEAALFLGARGGALHGAVVRRALARAREGLGLPPSVTPHAFRHAFATQLLAAGGDLRAVQQLLGHASLRATQVYTAVDETRLGAVYAAAHPRARGLR